MIFWISSVSVVMSHFSFLILLNWILSLCPLVSLPKGLSVLFFSKNQLLFLLIFCMVRCVSTWFISALSLMISCILLLLGELNSFSSRALRCALKLLVYALSSFFFRIFLFLLLLCLHKLTRQLGCQDWKRQHSWQEVLLPQHTKLFPGSKILKTWQEIQYSLWGPVLQTWDTCPASLPCLTCELQLHSCVSDPEEVGNTSTQGLSKSETCGDSPGLPKVLVSAATLEAGGVVGAASSQASFPEETTCAEGSCFWRRLSFLWC